MPAESSSPPWTEQQKDDCVRRGCHVSATLHADFLREEMAEFIENRFWAVLPYDMVKHLDDLQLWPAAVKDERDRKPRLLCDHSWDWGWPSLNETTIPNAPAEAMQFGSTLPRKAALGLSGLATGFFGGFAGMPGPGMAPFYLRGDLSAASARASMMAIFVVLTPLSAVFFIALGIGSWREAALAAALFPAVLIGDWLGHRAYGRVTARQWQVSTTLVLGGAALGALAKLF